MDTFKQNLFEMLKFSVIIFWGKGNELLIPWLLKGKWKENKSHL